MKNKYPIIILITLIISIFIIYKDTIKYKQLELKYKQVVIENKTLQEAIKNPRIIKEPVKVVVEKTNTKYINLSKQEIKDISTQYEIEIEKLNKIISHLKQTSKEKYISETDKIISEPALPEIPLKNKLHITFDYNNSLIIGADYIIYKSWCIGCNINNYKSFGIRIGKVF